MTENYRNEFAETLFSANNQVPFNKLIYPLITSGILASILIPLKIQNKISVPVIAVVMPIIFIPLLLLFAGCCIKTLISSCAKLHYKGDTGKIGEWEKTGEKSFSLVINPLAWVAIPSAYLVVGATADLAIGVKNCCCPN